MICTPKGAGGLGVHSLQDNLKAFHGKMAWTFLQQQSLWARYAKSQFTIGKPGSPIWNAISKQIARLSYRSYLELGVI